MSWDPENLVLLSGSGGDLVAEEIAGLIGLPSSSCFQCAVGGEAQIRLPQNVRGRDVYVVQSLAHPTNDHVIELALILSACRRASARRVCAIIPYLAYTRQTCKSASRVPVSAADLASIFEEACVNALVTVDIHTEQIAGFYSPRCAVECDTWLPTAARFLHAHGLSAPVVVAPHASGVARSVAFFDALRAQHQAGQAGAASAPTLAMLLPAVGANGGKSLELTGDVLGRDAIVVDDIIDSGNSAVRSSYELIEHGAARVFVVATHALLSRDARDRLAKAPIELVVTTNSVPTVITGLPAGHKLRRKLAVLSVAPLLAHRIAALAGLPRPDVDPAVPTYAMHAGGSRAMPAAGAPSPFGPASERRPGSVPDTEDFDALSLENSSKAADSDDDSLADGSLVFSSLAGGGG